MTKRRKWTAIPGLIALATGAVMLSAYSGASSSQNSSPTQPIAFPHPVHVGKLGINCVYCHYTANKSPDPGFPAVSTCMGCHTIIGPDRPASDLGPARKSAGIQKLWDYAGYRRQARQRQAHSRGCASTSCPNTSTFRTCATSTPASPARPVTGPSRPRTAVYQYASLNMGWCVSCHVNGYDPAQGEAMTSMVADAQGRAVLPAGYKMSAAATPDSARKKARYDCSVCHY